MYFDKKKVIVWYGASLLSQPSMCLEQDCLDNSFKIKSKKNQEYSLVVECLLAV